MQQNKVAIDYQTIIKSYFKDRGSINLAVQTLEAYNNWQKAEDEKKLAESEIRQLNKDFKKLFLELSDY